MSEERLKAKGLFGALVRIAGEFTTSMGPLPKTRHLHPWEMCVIHGGIPEFEWHPLRFSIAALGQMASPVQSCWVTGHLLSACDSAQGLPVRLPEEHLWNHFCRFAAAVSHTQQQVYKTDGFQMYMQEVRGVLLGRVATAKGPQCTALVVENDKNEENSQRTGRKDLLQIVPNGVIQQPAVKTQELVNGDKQPGIRPPEPETKKAEETQALHPPMSFQAMPPSAPVTGGPTPHPCEVGTSKSEQKLTEAFDQNAKHPHDCTPAESREIPIVKPDKCTGGLAAFAS